MFVVNRDFDGDFPAEMSVSTLHAKICGSAFILTLLAFDSGNNKDTIVPGKLHVRSVDAGHLDKNQNFVRALANIDRGAPCSALAGTFLKFEVHNYSRFFSRSFSSLMNS